ncbi:MAG: DinB family protein [Ktedonobacterales bacterium]|nr:DinB family protein [Ktedonobacterales bacterium]
MATGLADFFTYNLWANLRLLDTCETLTDAQLDATTPGVFGSVRETLVHLFSSEEGYSHHSHLTGPMPTPSLRAMTEFPGFAVLRQRAERSGRELRAIAEQANLDEIMHLDDGTYDCPLIIVLLQAIQHGIDHRSQIMTLLSVQGIEHPELDAWDYNDATFTQPSR